MDILPLSALERLSKSYLRELKEKPYDKSDDLDKLIYKAIVESDRGFSENPTELATYTKCKNGIKFNNYDGLNALKFPVGTSKSKGKSTKKKPLFKSANIIGSDLAQGFENFKKSSNEYIYQNEDLFLSLRQYIETSGGEDVGKDKNMITLRRNLLMLMLIPLTRRACKFTVTYSENFIFLDYDWEYYDMLESIDKFSISKSNSKQDLLQYTGFKFEDVITNSDSADGDFGFYTLMKHKVNSTSIIFTAEIDASINSKPKSPSDYVELKTHSVLSKANTNLPHNFVKKLISAWCQMKLIDCRMLVVGFRSADYKLSSIKKYDPNEITNLVNENPLFLNDLYSLNCSVLLDWYKVIIEWLSNHKPGTYSLEYDPKSSLLDSYLRLECVDLPSNLTHNKTVPEWLRLRN